MVETEIDPAYIRYYRYRRRLSAGLLAYLSYARIAMSLCSFVACFALRSNGCYAYDGLREESEPSIWTLDQMTEQAAEVAGQVVGQKPTAATHEDQTVRRRLTAVPKEKYVSVKTKEANVRKGPGTIYPTSFKIKGRYLPVKVRGTSGDWALVQTKDSMSGWIKTSFLSPRDRRAMPMTEKKLCRLPSSNARNCQAIAILHQNSNVKLMQCNTRWCRVEINRKLRGWVTKDSLWGIDGDEVF